MPTKAELYEKAGDLEIPGRSQMDKAELEKAVAKAERAAARAQDEAGAAAADAEGSTGGSEPAPEPERGAADGAASLQEGEPVTETATEAYAPLTGSGDGGTVSIVEGAPSAAAYVAGRAAITKEGVELGILGNPDLEAAPAPAPATPYVRSDEPTPEPAPQPATPFVLPREGR